MTEHEKKLKAWIFEELTTGKWHISKEYGVYCLKHKNFQLSVSYYSFWLIFIYYEGNELSYLFKWKDILRIKKHLKVIMKTQFNEQINNLKIPNDHTTL